MTLYAYISYLKEQPLAKETSVSLDQCPSSSLNLPYGPYLTDPHTFPLSSRICPSLPCRANILFIIPTTLYFSIPVDTSDGPERRYPTALNLS